MYISDSKHRQIHQSTPTHLHLQAKRHDTAAAVAQMKERLRVMGVLSKDTPDPPKRRESGAGGWGGREDGSRDTNPNPKPNPNPDPSSPAAPPKPPKPGLGSGTTFTLYPSTLCLNRDKSIYTE